MHCKFALCFRYNNANNDVLVYQISTDLPLGQNVSFQYKVTTVNNLLPSIFVSSPVYLYYVTLPPSLAPREGRKYEENSNQVFFLNCAMAVDSLLMNNSRMLHAWVWMGGGGGGVQYHSTCNFLYAECPKKLHDKARECLCRLKSFLRVLQCTYR